MKPTAHSCAHKKAWNWTSDAEYETSLSVIDCSLVSYVYQNKPESQAHI